MSLPEWVKKHKETKTEIKEINGFYYKYKVEYKYNPERKRTDKITKELLGKISKKEGFIPSEKYSLVEKTKEVPRIDIKTYGVFNLFFQLLKDEISTLENRLDQEASRILFVVSMMRFAYQSPIKRVQFLYEHDYASQIWTKKALNDKNITSALKFVGENRSTLINWMKSRLPVSEENDNFVMIDSTHISTQSENIYVNAKGYNPESNMDSQIRLMYIFSKEISLPIYYKLVNGNIPDVKSMRLCVEELSVKNVIFISDKGFYSKSNVKMLREESLFYVVPLHRNSALIDYNPLQKENFKKSTRNHFTYQKRIIWYYEYENDSQNVITYLDEKLRVEEETDYLLRVQTHPDGYSEDEFYKKLHRFGTITLLSFLPGDCSPKELYEIYKQRNEIEVMFDAYKNFLEADKTYMQDRYVLEGWLMANFIAMIAYCKLYRLLKNAELLSSFSPKDIVELSKKIYKIRIRDNWVLSETTKKVDSLFKKLDIDYLN